MTTRKPAKSVDRKAAPGLRIEYVAPATLKPAPYNPRRMDPAALKRLVALLDAHGFVDPIVARRSDTPAIQAGKGGPIPTPALQLSPRAEAT